MIPVIIGGLIGLMVVDEMTKKKPDDNVTTEKQEVSKDYVEKTLRNAGKKLSVKS